ncbi:MAG: ABC transporter substrate-binding protein [Actinobacteria bacterium]|nr:ABC transporter substrate-binding protein [Actinomycetota bacterium]
MGTGPAWRSSLLWVGLVVALAATACGSDSGGPAAAAVRGVVSAAAPHVEPCGPGDAHGATDTGVANDSLTIATIADVGGLRPDLFLGNWQAMDAFVAFCNSMGGVNGRRLVLRKLDSALFSERAQTLNACDTAFALVGSAAAQDASGAQAGADCGIPDIPAFSAEAPHSMAPNVVEPLPNPSDTYLAGPAKYLAQRFPDARDGAAMFYGSVGVTAVQARRQIQAYEQSGFRFTHQVPFDVVSPGFDGLVAGLGTRKLGYVSLWSEVGDFAKLLDALHGHGVRFVVAEGGQQTYDAKFLQSSASSIEGAFITTTTVPFAEASTSPEMQRYLHWLDVTHPGATPTALGVQGWSAGLLFADALRSLGSNVTRAGLLAALHRVHNWDGNGIHVPSDPGANRRSGCFMLVQVRNGAFVRAYPDRGFACSPDNVVALPKTFSVAQ